MSFHKSNLGRFGESLPVDIDGYCHTTIKEWMSAPIDWGTMRPSRDDRLEWARGQAAAARAAVKAGEAALANWRRNN